MALVGYKDKFKDSYTINTGDDVCNVINSFYKPALSNYISYDRNAGYFSLVKEAPYSSWIYEKKCLNVKTNMLLRMYITFYLK